MQLQATWRALAVTYGVIAGIQLYLAITTGAFWAWVLATVCTAAVVGLGVAAVHCSQAAHDDEVVDSRHRVVTSSSARATSSCDHLS